MPYKDAEKARSAAKERKRRWRERNRSADWTDGRGKHGHHARGPEHPRWNNGRLVSSQGYIKLRVPIDHHLADPNGYAYEHQVVAEQMMERVLLPSEIVHHRNHVRTDNRPENLEVMDRARHDHAGGIRDLKTGRFTSRGGPTPKSGGRLLDGREWNETPGLRL